MDDKGLRLSVNPMPKVDAADTVDTGVVTVDEICGDAGNDSTDVDCMFTTDTGRCLEPSDVVLAAIAAADTETVLSCRDVPSDVTEATRSKSDGNVRVALTLTTSNVAGIAMIVVVVAAVDTAAAVAMGSDGKLLLPEDNVGWVSMSRIMSSTHAKSACLFLARSSSVIAYDCIGICTQH